MNPKTIVVLGATLAVGGAAFLAVGHVRRAAAAQQEIAACTEKRSALARASASAVERLATLAEQRCRLEAPRPESKPAPVAAIATATETGGAQAVDPKMAAKMAAYAKTPFGDIVLEKDPTLQARYLATRRAEWTAKYGAFWASAGLTEPQIDAFIAILVGATARELDLKATTRAQGLTESDPAIAKLRAEAAQRTAAAQRELLGEAAFQRWQDYERNLPMRMVVDGLAASFVLLDAPLNAAQADRLTQILVEANEGYRRNGRPIEIPRDILARLPAREEVDSVWALDQAREILSPTQHARLEADLARMRLVYRLVNLMAEASDGPLIGFRIGRP